MAFVVKMPKLGFDMAEGTLVRWLVREGEPVEKGAVLAEIETDKATVEVASDYTGVLARQLVPAGEVVPVNKPIAVISASGEAVDLAALGLAESSSPTTARPAAATPPAEKSAVAATRPPSEAPTAAAVGRLPGGVRASPLARRIAMEMHLNLEDVPGSGPAGRISKRDIEAFLALPAKAAMPAISPLSIPAAAPGSAAPAASKPAPLPGVTPLSLEPVPTDQLITLPRLRLAIGRRMAEAKQQVPHFYVTHEYDMQPLLDLRQQANALLPEEEKISVNDFVVKAAALTLRQFPNLNASLHGSEVLRHGQINVGVAVAVEGGLLTVVCRDADRKPLRQIASEVRSMIERARDGKVRPEDIEGSTFSVSNLGMFDVEHFIAIINPPEAAILAVGSARQVPVVKDGQILPGIRMKATLSVDHRVSDGAEAARFLQAMAVYLEQPLTTLV